jgi:hypothetical protein
VGRLPSSDLLYQLHLRAVRRGNPAHMPTVVDALFEDLRAVLPCAFAQSFEQLFILRGLHGLGVGGEWAPARC